jgi:hypothetical protein
MKKRVGGVNEKEEEEEEDEEERERERKGRESTQQDTRIISCWERSKTRVY